MLGIPLGLLYANASEWLIHKYVLHGSGKKPKSFFSFHWVEHHRASGLHDMRDPDYERSVFGDHAQGREALALALAGVAHLPLLPVAPFFTATVLYSGLNYYRKHKRAHLDPEWAKTHLPWHYDHHMAPNQEANWCVTHPFFDHVMGTRERYLGTERERRDAERRQARRRAREARLERQAAEPRPAPDDTEQLATAASA